MPNFKKFQPPSIPSLMTQPSATFCSEQTCYIKSDYLLECAIIESFEVVLMGEMGKLDSNLSPSFAKISFKLASIRREAEALFKVDARSCILFESPAFFICT